MLYSLIFGESILNDAVSFMMFDTTIKLYTSSADNLFLDLLNFILVFLASIIIGLLIGIASAYVNFFLKF